MAKQTHDIGAQKRLRNEIVVEEARLLKKIKKVKMWKRICKQKQEFLLRKINGKYYPTTLKNVKVLDLIDTAVPGSIAA